MDGKRPQGVPNDNREMFLLEESKSRKQEEASGSDESLRKADE
jgi:hypothetical protein